MHSRLLEVGIGVNSDASLELFLELAIATGRISGPFSRFERLSQ
jgi:hypothetical protein